MESDVMKKLILYADYLEINVFIDRQHISKTIVSLVVKSLPRIRNQGRPIRHVI